MGRRRRGYVLASLVLVVAYPLLPPRGRPADFLIVSLGVLVPIAVGAHRVDPQGRRPWVLLLCGFIAINIGNVLVVAVRGSGAAPGRLFDAAGLLLVLAAALDLVVRRGRNDLGGVIDATIFALAASGVLWEALIRPHLVGAYQSGAARLDIFVVVFVLSGVVGALARLAQTAPGSVSGLRLLLAALTLALAANLLFVLQPARWTLTVGVMMLLVGYTALGLFGLDPTAPQLARPAVTAQHDAISGRRLVFLGAVVSVIPVVTGVRVLRGAPVDGWLLIVGCAAIAVLVMVRIGRLSAERSRAEAALVHHAAHDPLTGLANRREFVARLDAEIAGRTRSAVLFCDLDDFKAVNDRLGHAAGDVLLVEVAKRLRTCVRESDTVSRFGGDEFLILVDGGARADVLAICRRIADAVSAPFDVLGEPVTVGVSIGVAVAADGTDAEDLIRQADQAMYAAKHTEPPHHGIRMVTPPRLDPAE